MHRTYDQSPASAASAGPDASVEPGNKLWDADRQVAQSTSAVTMVFDWEVESTYLHCFPVEAHGEDLESVEGAAPPARTPFKPMDRVEKTGQDKRKLIRRANSCVHCRRSKLKCDGLLPSCTACMKRRVERPVCNYRPASPERKPATYLCGKFKIKKDLLPDWDGQHPHQDKNAFGAYSMTRCVDLFRSLTDAQDPGRLRSVPQSSGLDAFDAATLDGTIVNKTAEKRRWRALAPIPESKNLTPKLSHYRNLLYDEVERVHRLVCTGETSRAWALIPGLVHLADTDRMDDTETEAIEIHRRLCWSILALDVRVAMCTGSLPAVYNNLVAEFPTLDGLKDIYRDLIQSQREFHAYALEILNSICVDHAHAVTPFSERSKLDRLRVMAERFPDMSLDDIDDEKLVVAVSDQKIEVHAFRMLLSCVLALFAQRRHRMVSMRTADQSRATATSSETLSKRNYDEAYFYQTAILDSARSILYTYETVAQLDNIDQYVNWDSYSNTYCAVVILAIGLLRGRTTHPSDFRLIRRISNNMTAKPLPSGLTAAGAIRVQKLWAEVRKVQVWLDPRGEIEPVIFAYDHESPSSEPNTEPILLSDERKSGIDNTPPIQHTQSIEGYQTQTHEEFQYTRNSTLDFGSEQLSQHGYPTIENVGNIFWNHDIPQNPFLTASSQLCMAPTDTTPLYGNFDSTDCMLEGDPNFNLDECPADIATFNQNYDSPSTLRMASTDMTPLYDSFDSTNFMLGQYPNFNLDDEGADLATFYPDYNNPGPSQAPSWYSQAFGAEWFT